MSRFEGWCTSELRQLADIGSGSAANYHPNDFSGRFLVYGANGPIGSHHTANFGPGYTVGRVGAAGYVTTVSERVWASDNALTVTPKSSTDNQFLGHLLRFLDPRKLTTTTAQPLVTQTQLAQLSAYVPPLPEQRRIAAILDTLDRTIEGTQRVIEKLQATRQGLLHDLLIKGLDENGQLRDPERNPEQFKETELGRVPVGWAVGRVEDFGEVRLGRQRSPQHQSGRYTTPYLRVANVFDGWINYSDVLEMDFTPSEKAVYGLLSGDILLNEGQSLNLVGRPAMYEGEPGMFCYQNTLVRFRCGPRLLPSYALSVFKRYLDTGVFQTIAKQTTSVAHLGADRFAKLLLAVPPLCEQEAAVSLLDAAATKIADDQRQLAKLQDLKRGLMEDLLTGRVRVPVAGVGA